MFSNVSAVFGILQSKQRRYVIIFYTREKGFCSSDFMITLRQRFYVGDQTEEKEKDNVLLNQFQKILHPRIGLFV